MRGGPRATTVSVRAETGVEIGDDCLRFERPAGGSRLLWALRHYAWVVLVCVLALAAAPLMLPPAAPQYQAAALVVARQVTVPRDVLPQMAEAVFASGAVAANVAGESVSGRADGLIPDRLSVVAGEDSIALVVQARDPDPATAERMANLAADAFVVEMNRPGAGVGEFLLQAPAVLPTEPLEEAPPTVRAAVGALAGLVLGLGLVALAGAVRRPVITVHDVQTAAGVPLLGTVNLPARAEGKYAGPLGVPAIMGVARWLAALPPGRLLLISPPGAATWTRQRMFVMVGVALGALRTVRVEGPPELVDAIQELAISDQTPGDLEDTQGAGVRELVVVDGGSSLELVDPATTRVSVVAVAPLGIPGRRLRALAAEYVGGGLVGVVLVDARLAARRAAARGVRAAAVSRAPRERWRSIRDVPEPERA